MEVFQINVFHAEALISFCSMPRLVVFENAPEAGEPTKKRLNASLALLLAPAVTSTLAVRTVKWATF